MSDGDAASEAADRLALDRLRADQAYRDRLAAERGRALHRLGAVAALLASLVVVAGAIAQLLRLL